MKENIKTAIELAEQEVQEKEIAQLKSIVKNLLEKKAKCEEEKRNIEKEISIIKQTIDDFKAGRLDKVKELIEKDNVAKDLLPFKIIIINQPIYNQPWKWTYQVTPTYPSYSYTTTSGGNGLMSLSGTETFGASAAINTAYCSSDYGSSGTNYATFTSGTYSLNDGRIINL